MTTSIRIKDENHIRINVLCKEQGRTLVYILGKTIEAICQNGSIDKFLEVLEKYKEQKK